MATMNSHGPVLGLAVVAAVVAGCNVTRSAGPAIESSAPPAAHVLQDLVGPGCDAYLRQHSDGPGSPAAVARQTAAVAIKGHPQLTQFAKAISGGLNPKVSLVGRLDAGDFTIFAPTDSAFAKLPPASLQALAKPGSAGALTDLLMSHVVQGQRSPGKLAGSLETLDEQDLTVTATGDRIRVAGQANVICGGLHAANATLYLIDTVLMPPVRPKE
jgi:uncharacterized surface protein with fasciclin (FAS1) repeats